MNVEIHERARTDVAEQAEWYEKKQTGLGFDFLSAVDVGVERLRQARDLPQYEAVSDSRIRRLLLDRFPHVLICQQFAEDRVLLLAVAHTSRDAGFWRQRLQ